MPPAKTYKCAVCQDPINKSDHSIQCTNCKLWLHLLCADIEKKHLDLIRENLMNLILDVALVLVIIIMKSLSGRDEGFESKY